MGGESSSTCAEARLLARFSSSEKRGAPRDSKQPQSRAASLVQGAPPADVGTGHCRCRAAGSTAGTRAISSAGSLPQPLHRLAAELAGEGWLGNGRCSATSSSPAVMLQLRLRSSAPALADCRAGEVKAQRDGSPPSCMPSRLVGTHACRPSCMAPCTEQQHASPASHASLVAPRAPSGAPTNTPLARPPLPPARGRRPLPPGGGQSAARSSRPHPGTAGTA